MKSHPRYHELQSLLKQYSDRLQTCWRRSVFRCVEFKWARPEYLISGEGSRKYGSRWLRPGLTEVVYAASTENLALKESRRIFQYYGIRQPRKTPRVSVEILPEFHSMADLRKIETVLSWPTIGELLAEDWRKINLRGRETLSQAVGRALVDFGFEGLIAPSARDRRANSVIWFPGHLQERSRVRISGMADLDQWLK